ncbi:NAD(P)/FAD-dependent oxidoreductase [Piscinibacter sp.]|jgi:gamma-glutamylputrescine oxidase|uniref:NAD(P)/FAD-dependent oxidoreductase n=1 Tax=Piscinibacter sp. TaxID=1903157 RepID=UPI002F3E8EA6
MSFLSADRELAQDSYYATTVQRTKAFASLEGSVECDVAIAGGGISGLSAAIELAERGYQVVLLEARQLGWGASGRNGGQAIAGLACDQFTVERQLGLDEARRIWAMTLEAIDLIEARRRRFEIDCDWRSGFLLLAVNARKGHELRQWQARMARDYGHETHPIEPGELPAWIASPRFHSGLHDPRSGHLNPLKYTLGLVRAAAALGVRLFEHSALTRLVPGSPLRLCTAAGEVRAPHALLAGNVYLQDVVPALGARVMPVGTYLVATEPLGPTLMRMVLPSLSAACDSNFVLDYFRPTPEHRLLFGGRVSYSTATPANLADGMRRRMALTFPQLKDIEVEHAWGGFIDISMNRAPDFGRLSDVTHDSHRAKQLSQVYYLQGFSGHGLALSGLAGKLVAEAIDGNASRFDTFARIRHRPFPGGRLLRMPALVAGMAYYRLKDIL